MGETQQKVDEQRENKPESAYKLSANGSFKDREIRISYRLAIGTERAISRFHGLHVLFFQRA